jgi:hypothetical protein
LDFRPFPFGAAPARIRFETLARRGPAASS